MQTETSRLSDILARSTKDDDAREDVVEEKPKQKAISSRSKPEFSKAWEHLGLSTKTQPKQRVTMTIDQDVLDFLESFSKNAPTRTSISSLVNRIAREFKNNIEQLVSTPPGS